MLRCIKEAWLEAVPRLAALGPAHSCMTAYASLVLTPDVQGAMRKARAMRLLLPQLLSTHPGKASPLND